MHLADQRFELVVFHHAINEARANNCPPEMFRDDYTHYAWYRPIRIYDADPHRVFALPITLRYAGAKLAPQMGLVDVVPKNEPRKEWLKYGADVKTAGPFRRNLEWIADTAAERGDPFVAVTFASYVPEGYTDEKFRNGELGFTPGGQPTSLWGRTDNVVEAIRIHNAITREIGARSDVALVEMADAVPHERRYWRDICHFSEEGRKLWAKTFVRRLREKGLLPE
jgi:hypothetical protein